MHIKNRTVKSLGLELLKLNREANKNPRRETTQRIDKIEDELNTRGYYVERYPEIKISKAEGIE